MTCQTGTDCRPCECEDPIEPHTCKCGDVELTDGRYENATVIIEKGCITSVEQGEVPLYTPNVCCSGAGSGGTGAQGPQGERGPAGQNATISIGNVQTLAPGSNATVVNVGTTTDAILDFGIPAGDTGKDAEEGLGITSDKGGIAIENGRIISLPATWPPVLYVTATSDSYYATLTATPDPNTGVTTIAFSISEFESRLRTYIDDSIEDLATRTQEHIDNLQSQITNLQSQITSARNDITALQTRVSKLESK